MSFLVIVVIFIALLFGAMYIYGLTQPRIAILERRAVVPADQQTVYARISSLRAFVTWSPWSAKDPTMTQTFEGEDGTVGSVYRWKGTKSVGEGTMTITGLNPTSRVEMTIDFGHRGRAAVAFVLENEGDHRTAVTWRFESDMGSNPITRCAQPLMKRFIGKDFEAGLANLQRQF